MDHSNSPSPVAAATAIFLEHSEFIRTTIRVHARGRADLEDLYQEFYLELTRKPLPADVENIRGYLYRAICNHVVDAMRRRESRARTLKKYARETGNSINNREPANASVDEEHKNATATRLARHLQHREAQAFLLKYRDECSNHEIARKMGIDKRTVTRYLSESLRKLQRRLAAE